ncbi:MAG: hypothetical protein GPJ54_18620 [Candidatus Heimdallarchaeota archaeon]|nr:hypothetical protein [Candidatus Heimdallarchaeota archaeon]
MKSEFIDTRNALFGIILAIIVFSLSYQLAPIVFETDSSTDNIWNFKSPSTVSASMTSNVGELVYSRILTGTISSTITNDGNVNFGFSSNPIFSGNVQEVVFYKNIIPVAILEEVNFSDPRLDTDDWILQREICCIEIRSTEFNKSEGLFENLYDSLSKDFSEIIGYSNITANLAEEITDLQKLNGESYWLIENVYRDGQRVEIQVFGTNIIITTIQVKGIVYGDGSIGIIVDLNSSFNGYSGFMDTVPLQNYKNTIDEILTEIISEM